MEKSKNHRVAPTDVFSKKKRSDVMSRIRGRNNLSTELRLASLFRKYGLSGWRRHHPIKGRPDFVFPESRLAVFVDGCFWHACPRCFQKPKQNRLFWSRKISRNIRRDISTNRRLRYRGWAVLRVRECRLEKYPDQIVRTISKKLNPAD